MNDDYLEKLCKLEELPVNNILKIAECLYSKENKINKQDFFSEKWFICSCSDRDLSLICEECSKICHSNHKNKIEIPRSKLTMPICKCGKSRHRIPEALEENYKVNYEEFHGNCFISELSSNTLNKGYYKANNHIICHYCWDKCYNNNQDAFILIENSYLGISIYSCKCEFHKEKNFLSFSTEQEYKFIQKNMENYICMYNLNIFKKIPLFNNSFFKNNNDKFELICADDKNLIKMYSRFSLQNLMICFQKFDELRNQKYYYLKNYFDKLDINIFFQSLRDKNFIGKDVNYLYFQALLILIMFNTYVKSQYVKNNNLFGIDAILNMNPFQRNFFLLESKKFRNYTSEMKKGGLSEKYKEDKSVNMNEDEFSNLVDNFTDSILDFSENFIKLIGTHIIQVENILDDFFQWINKIFKFLIKYNLISLHKKIRFLEIMLDAFTLCTGNLKGI